MTIIVAGIDPGLSGAIAFYVPSVRRAAVYDMPVIGGEISAPLLADLVRDHKPMIGIIERVGAMPKQGVVSMFNFGRSVGDVRGVFGALRIPLVYVTPQTWKKAFGLIGREKDESRKLAVQMFPSMAADLKLKKHHGRAEAILIAQWGANELRTQLLDLMQANDHTTKGENVSE